MDFYVLTPGICAVVYGALAVIVLRYPTRARIVFALYLIAGIGWSACSAIAHLPLPHQQTYLWMKLLIVASWPMMLLYYHFVCRFTNHRPDRLVYAGYGLWLVIIVLTALGYILKDAYFFRGALYLDYGENNMNLQLLGVSAAPFMAAALIRLSRLYNSSTDPVVRNRAVYLIMGILAYVAFGVTLLIPSLLGKYPLDYIGGIVNGLIISYVILRYRLLNIKLVLRKGLVYSTLTVFLTALYLLLLFALQMLFQGWLGYRSLILAAVIALVAALLFNPLRDLVQQWIDRLFYRETYDYRRMLYNFTSKISNVLDLGELARSILDPIVEAMHVKQAALLFPEFESGDFKTRFVQQATKEKPFTKLRFPGDSPIITWLANEGKALRRGLIEVIPQFKGLWEVERIALDALGVELLCPIRSRGNLIGILALGRKQSDSKFSEEETDLLITMANEAAVAIENARMLDDLKSQQLQVEQLLAQVVLAQEEERNRISIDLHDSVAQWLVAASYGVQTFQHAISNDKAGSALSALADMESTISKSLKELRRVVVGLRPPALDELGLTHALRQSLEELKSDGLDCKYSEVGTPVRLQSSMEIAVYRVVQETLSNIRRHAEATKVSLRLQFHEDKLLVEVQDNGKGFDLSQTLGSAISGGHLGLLGMKQRAEMLGGDLKVKTAEGKGTSITLRLPIRPRVKEG